MYKVNRTFWFSAAHRLEGHPKCGRLHGHNYKVVIVAEAPILVDGMVMDFSDIDDLVKPIIEEYDHRYLVSQENIGAGDPYYNVALVNKLKFHLKCLDSERSTAECIAKEIFSALTRRMDALGMPSSAIQEVRVWEAEKSMAAYVRL